MKNPPYGGFFTFSDRHDKPNSVRSFDRDDHLSGPAITGQLERRSPLMQRERCIHGARPCTGVRIWPFQPEVASRTLYERVSSLSASIVSARTSRLAADGHYPLPDCRRQSRRPVFGLSSLQRTAERSSMPVRTYYTISIRNSDYVTRTRSACTPLTSFACINGHAYMRCASEPVKGVDGGVNEPLPPV